MQRVTATPDHPWLVERDGAAVWVETIDLKPGDQLVTQDADRLTFRNATLREDLAQTYNLEVADFHTFLIGEDGVVVHNKCPWFNPNFVPQALRDAINKTLGRLNAGARGQTFRNELGQLPSGVSYSKLRVNTPENNVRIIQGSGGSRYITFDHYESFSRIR